ncbi:ANTAR domain-containing protein [Mycobacterium kubicae]|uniref:ANTAR domain-containing protein n=1 Tax=Mycobacterium kubicae TaxID=120959 RepID=UPI000AE24B57|nr:ANTAR domain-containing protein [Mycobacterium kubicae]
MIEGLDTQPRFSGGRNETTRSLDTAVGILVGWRRCSTYAAFRELISVSERQGVPIFALAGALVNLASRDADNQPADAAAQLAAEREWGLTHLL